MTTTAKNRIVRTIAQNSVFEDITSFVTSSSTFNQGDLMVLDTSTHLVRIATTESSDSANFLGISRVTVVNGVPQGPYQGLATSNNTAIGAIPGPVFGVEAAMLLKLNDVFLPGIPVYLIVSSGAQTVAISGTNPIGCYNGPAITGSAINTGNIRLGCVYQKGALNF